jgi:hypothetical protein
VTDRIHGKIRDWALMIIFRLLCANTCWGGADKSLVRPTSRCRRTESVDYSSLLVQLKDILKEKRRGKASNGVLFLHDNAPAHRALATHNWPNWASSFLITHPILRIWSRRTTTCSLDWKSNWKVAIFRPSRRSLLPRRLVWTDNFLIFLSASYKLEQLANKCIELRWEYVE